MEQKLYEDRLGDRMKERPELVAREQIVVKLMNSYGYNHA